MLHKMFQLFQREAEAKAAAAPDIGLTYHGEADGVAEREFKPHCVQALRRLPSIRKAFLVSATFDGAAAPGVVLALVSKLQPEAALVEHLNALAQQHLPLPTRFDVITLPPKEAGAVERASAPFYFAA